MGALLRIEELSVHFPVRKGLLQRQVAEVRAVEGVTLSLDRGEAFGLVGESGCGKTTLARTVLRLVDPTSGAIWFDGQNVSDLKGKLLAPYRKKVAAIFRPIRPDFPMPVTTNFPLVDKINSTVWLKLWSK